MWTPTHLLATIHSSGHQTNFSLALSLRGVGPEAPLFPRGVERPSSTGRPLWGSRRQWVDLWSPRESHNPYRVEHDDIDLSLLLPFPNTLAGGTMKSLNASGGKNRLRFQGVGARIEEARVRVDVIHKV